MSLLVESINSPACHRLMPSLHSKCETMCQCGNARLSHDMEDSSPGGSPTSVADFRRRMYQSLWF